MYELGILLIGLFFGWTAKALMEALRMQRMYERVMHYTEMMDLEESLLDKIFKTCYVEQEGESYYLYDSNSSKFLCQGKDYDQLAKCLYNEHDIQVALVKKSEKEHLWFDHGTIKNVKVITR